MDAKLLDRIACGNTTASDAAALRDQMFILAHQIADAEACMDYLKRIHAPAERAEAERHVEALHDIAQHLAGDRVNEIYAPEDARTPYCEEA